MTMLYVSFDDSAELMAHRAVEYELTPDVLLFVMLKG